MSDIYLASRERQDLILSYVQDILNVVSGQDELAKTGDNSIQFELQTLNQALMMLEQRVQDLRTAENVAMQSIPMLKTMEFSNYNLVRKINSAFIILKYETD